MSLPRLARWLVGGLAPRDRRDDTLGDLEELHARRRAVLGARRAWLATQAEAAAVAAAWLIERARAAAWLDARHAISADNLSHGVRLLRTHPFVSATATLALALGIGLATVGFAFTEALLFSRLPFDGGDRFIRIEAVQEPDRTPASLAPGDYARLASQATALTHVGAAAARRANLDLPSGATEIATVTALTPSSLRWVPHRPPIHGRGLLPADGAPGAERVAVLREPFWKRAFGAADVVGTSIDIGGERHTIVGVVDETLEFPNAPDVFVAMREGFREGRGVPDAGARLFGVLAEGRSLDEAQGQLQAIATQVVPAPDARGPVRLDAVGFTDLGPQAVIMATAAVAVVLAVLVVVAANVGNLILARSFTRARELAVRAALGASRPRIVGQIAVEVLLLGGLAALVGTMAAQAILRQFNTIDEMPFWVDFTGGPLTMLAIVGATLVAVAVAGAWPAVRATRGDLMATLHAGDGRTSDVRFGRLAGAMVVVQIAVSVVMLHGALIVAEGASAYTHGTIVLPANVLKAGLAVSAGEGPVRRGALRAPEVAEVEALAAAMPGVLAGGLSTALPRHSPPAMTIEIEPRGGEPPAPAGVAPYAEVSEGFFRVLDGAALDGRTFEARDFGPDAPPVAVVNAPFVRKFLGDGSPVGRRLRRVSSEGPGPWQVIVGVVPDLGLSIGDPAMAAGFYVPIAPGAWREDRLVYLALRVDGNPAAFVDPLRRVLRERDPDLVPNRPGRLEDVADEDRTFFVWFARALSGLGAATLVLALAGVYAMMTLIVARRTREIGVRMALGATTGRVARTVLARAAWQVGLGAAVGAVLAVVSLDLRSVLVSRLGDGGPWTLPIVIALLAGASLAATWAPLARALRVQPSDALRTE